MAESSLEIREQNGAVISSGIIARRQPLARVKKRDELRLVSSAMNRKRSDCSGGPLCMHRTARAQPAGVGSEAREAEGGIEPTQGRIFQPS